MNLSDYQNLPDVLSSREIRDLFMQVLEESKDTDAEKKITLTRALWELADRQWHTYEKLDASTLTRLDDWVHDNWESQSVEMTKWVVGVIGNLGLPKSYDRLRHALNDKLPQAVRSDIEGLCTEIGETIDDPYSSLKKGRIAK